MLNDQVSVWVRVPRNAAAGVAGMDGPGVLVSGKVGCTDLRGTAGP